ncbi:glutaredoxin [Pueribacillus theae]|uniref:Glutaredoxin n=1 Tax=Pueribacillus theae TaxID=2171751 RepID=A0A2U1K5J4_9BACI|nr:glutaredoxin family protein [Pueribacillus theae]PWA12652.1 glutaredoxin [Pueribacillus theae]
MQVYFYTKENCPLCDEAEQILRTLQDDFSYTINKIDIYTDDSLLETYQIRIPVIEVSGQVIAEGIVTETEITGALRKIIHDKNRTE